MIPRRCVSRLVPVVLGIICLLAQPPTARARHFQLTPFLTHQDTVVAITHAGDDRLFLVAKEGRVWIIRGGVRQAQPYLDIRDRVLFTGEPESEQGLLSVAFHPDYATNGYLFAAYTREDGVGVISRFGVTGPSPDRASSGSERVLLEVPQPGANHNLNHLLFGPDGYLYVSSGDGGYQPEPLCTPQDGGSLLGKLLRLDVDANTDSPPYHAIPPDNPFVGDPSVRDEIWALGVRNAWRFTWDAETDDFWLADVGHKLREEIDFLPAGTPGGQNWGFKMMEGFRCRGRDDGCAKPVPPCFDPAYTDPILDYGHDARHCAVIGGPAYRGTAIPELQGAFLAGDYCGATFVVHHIDGAFALEELSQDVFGLVTFGQDAAGEVYLAAEGTIYRLADLIEDVTVQFSVPELTVSEAAGSAFLDVLRQGGSGQVSVAYAVTPLSAGPADFEAADGVLTWPLGDSSPKTIHVALHDDAELEGTERFLVELSDPSGAELGSVDRAEVVILDDEIGGPCVPSASALCLGSGRFRVTAVWRDFEAGAGVASAVPLAGVVDDPQGTAQSGLMTFFGGDNVELVVKVLDGCAINQHHWVLVAAATTVDYSLEILDTGTGDRWSYRNPLGVRSPAIAEIEAFSCQ